MSVGVVQISWRYCYRQGAQGFSHPQHYLQDGPSPPGLAQITIMVAQVCSVLAVRQVLCKCYTGLITPKLSRVPLGREFDPHWSDQETETQEG